MNKRAPGWLGFIGDEKLPSYIGIIIIHYKDSWLMWRFGQHFCRRFDIFPAKTIGKKHDETWGPHSHLDCITWMAFLRDSVLSLSDTFYKWRALWGIGAFRI